MSYRSVSLLLLLLLCGASSAGEQAATRQYTYAWPFASAGDLAPRGGTTKGPELTFETEPSDAWLALQDDELSAYEKDRLAILAMAGPYRASFDFLETTGFVSPYAPPRPYQSWGTEHVYVIADEPGFLSLQHVLVMQILQQDGTLTEPYVVKHWRQDWTYEDRELFVYQGDRQWVLEKLPRKTARRAWTQAVFQVDDSPRYEAVGRWQHGGGVSTWLSSETWRPLPRREYSVRDDYDVLIGTNRHTVTPTGWVHEELNYKAVLKEPGVVERLIAKEAGFNRYERIRDYDWSAGDAYLKRTGPFWAAVRRYWQRQFETQKTLRVAESLDNKPMMFTLFALAEASGPKDADELLAEAEATIAPYLSP